MTSPKGEVTKNQSFHLFTLIVMKLPCLIFTIFIVSFGIAKGEIKNGYVDVNNAREALNSLLNASPTQPLTLQQSRKVKERIRILTEHIMYFQITETLLLHFRVVAPDLYDEMNRMQDKDGKPTNVFVKFILKEHSNVQHPGTTYIQYKPGDNTCFSEYGVQSASVKVWIMDTSLTILAHELGHVKYEVPNLAAYDAYHRENYRSLNHEPNYIGHSPNDPSGKSAACFEKRFSESYRSHMKASSAKVPSPFKVRDEILKTKKDLLSLRLKG